MRTATVMHRSFDSTHSLDTCPFSSSRGGQLFKRDAEIRDQNAVRERGLGGKWGDLRRQNEKFTDWHRIES